MKNQDKIKAVSNRENRISGNYSTFQELGNKLYSQSKQQVKHKLKAYNVALYGLNSFTRDEVAQMSSTRKKKIEKTNRKAQLEINLLKQERLISFTNSIFSSMFSNSKIASDIVDLYSEPQGFSYQVNKLSLKDLNITKTDIEHRLVDRKVLPSAYQLNL